MEPEIRVCHNINLVNDPLTKCFEYLVLKLKSRDFLDVLLNTNVIENSERQNSNILCGLKGKTIIQEDHKTTCKQVEPIFDVIGKRNYMEMNSTNKIIFTKINHNSNNGSEWTFKVPLPKKRDLKKMKK